MPVIAGLTRNSRHKNSRPGLCGMDPGSSHGVTNQGLEQTVLGQTRNDNQSKTQPAVEGGLGIQEIEKS